MKKILIALTAILAVGCGGKGGSGNSKAGIFKAIIGAWEIDSMFFNGQSMKPNRPDPNNPYADRNVSEWTQLQIDEKTLTLISTDFVHFSEPQLPYKVEGNKVITIDEENFSMTDFVVHSYSSNSLTLEFLSEGNSPQGVKHVFKRINESKLATKTAQSLTFKQSIKASVEREGLANLEIDKTVAGRTNYEQEGLHDSINCSLNNEDKLQFYYMILEVDGDSVGSDSSRDYVSITFSGVNLDLNGPQKSVNSNSKARVGVKSEGGTFAEDVTNCIHTIDRKGAALQISTNCTSDDGKKKVAIEASCLLRHSEW
ncbi:MAG: hypothetical protein H6626_05680 [Pseudobdellovibrionaceae bacterium]|nr:MAG: hypothetical protein H6626_05680 [Pseudobdellovibrionaceae bacterium]